MEYNFHSRLKTLFQKARISLGVRVSKAFYEWQFMVLSFVLHSQNFIYVFSPMHWLLQCLGRGETWRLWLIQISNFYFLMGATPGSFLCDSSPTPLIRPLSGFKGLVVLNKRWSESIFLRVYRLNYSLDSLVTMFSECQQTLAQIYRCSTCIRLQH